jgi:hypothetical protein
MNNRPPAQPADAAGALPPSRPAAFLVTLFAAFVVALTVLALTNHQRISRDHLQQLAGISLGVAILSLIPSRKTIVPEPELTPQQIAKSTGLSVLGNMFAGPASKTSTKTPRSQSLLTGLVSTSELLLCTAFMLSLTACFLKPELFALFRHSPLDGYAEAVRHLFGTVQAWLPLAPATT